MRTDFFTLKEKILLEGVMPERALLRVRRAGIAVFDGRKIQKNQLIFTVKRKDVDKVFAIYPNARYGNAVGSAYTAKRLGSVGLAKLLDFFKVRVGLPMGAALCLIVALAVNPFVFSVETVGTSVYKREAVAALEEVGIAPFRRYDDKEIDGVCAKLLALDGVEYCSVRKTGGRVLVEIRESPFQTRTVNEKSMTAKHTGTVLAMAVLRGTPLKKIGEEIKTGETLVENCFYSQDGGQVRVEIIARVRIGCVWEEEIEAEGEEEAFATAYLQVGLTPLDELKKRTIEKKDGCYHVRLEYEAVETWNME